MRTITEIIIHCSDSRPDQDIDAATIDRWHKYNGWKGIGYHYFIKLDGTIQTGRPIAKIGAHCYGHNNNSIGICYAGGMVRVGNNKYYKDTRTPEQKKAMKDLVVTLLHAFPTIKKISGHNDYTNKACPCFDVHNEFDVYIDNAPIWEELRKNEKQNDYDMNDLMW